MQSGPKLVDRVLAVNVLEGQATGCSASRACHAGGRTSLLPTPPRAPLTGSRPATPAHLAPTPLPLHLRVSG